MASSLGHCDYCGNHTAVHQVSYRQNTGMLVARQSRTWSGSACKSCSGGIFRKATLHTMFLGWWGTISLFLTPIYIISNIACWVGSLSLPTQKALLGSILDGRREYALNMLGAGKDEATIVGVLAKETNLPEDEITRWLRALQTKAA